MILPQFAPQNNLFYPIISSIKVKDIMENNIGFKYGKWMLVEYKGRDKKGEQIFLCKCECGTLKEHRFSTLRSLKSTQCKSCYMNKLNKIQDFTGQKFSLWTAIERYKNIERNEWWYKCICECGTKANIPGHRLKNGNSNKCPHCRVKTHGMSYTTTFKIWAGILRRCLNQNFKAYKYYGGRGIKVCDRWRTSFENFLSDMGIRPYGLQIDRIDNNGHYEPGNCRWVTPKINNSNRNIMKRGKK